MLVYIQDGIIDSHVAGVLVMIILLTSACTPGALEYIQNPINNLNSAGQGTTACPPRISNADPTRDINLRAQSRYPSQISLLVPEEGSFPSCDLQLVRSPSTPRSLISKICHGDVRDVAQC